MSLEREHTVFVTGAAGGIGLAVVKAFAAKGFVVYANARCKDGEFEAEIRDIAKKHQTSVNPVYFDLRDQDAMKASIADLYDRRVFPDILINNAGVPHGRLFQMTPISEIESVFEVNLFAHMRLTQLLLRGMRKRGCGSIVNVSSISGIELSKGNSAYGVSKAALAAWTEVMGKELSGTGIRINAIAPGLVKTRMGDFAIATREKAANEMRFDCSIQPSDVANAIAFLACEEGRCINGQILRLDDIGSLR